MIGAILSGLVGGLGEQYAEDQKMKHLEDIKNKQFVLDSLSEQAKDPNTTDEGRRVILDQAAQIVGLKGKDLKRLPEMWSHVQTLLSSKITTPLDVGTIGGQTMPTPMPEGGNEMALPGRAVVPSVATAPGAEVTSPYRYQPGQREAAELQQKLDLQDRYRRSRTQEELRMIPGLGLGPEMEKYAKAEAVLGRNLPTMPQHRAVKYEWGQDAGGKSYYLPEEQLAALGLQKVQPMPTPTTYDKQKADAIALVKRQHTGWSDVQVQDFLDKKKERLEAYDEIIKRNQGALLGRQATEPSAGALRVGTESSQQLEAAQKQARAEAKSLLAPGSAENIAFIRQNKRQPTQADVERFASERFDAIIYDTWGLTPQELQGRTQGMSFVNPPAGSARGGNPNWKPLVR